RAQDTTQFWSRVCSTRVPGPWAHRNEPICVACRRVMTLDTRSKAAKFYGLNPDFPPDVPFYLDLIP
ncbi:MAG: hypothetical protein P8Y94_06695, partial [Acidobacteriota bacterium]